MTSMSWRAIEVLRDRLDLVGRAPVERRQRDRVGDVRREVEVAELREHRVVRDLRAQPLDLVGRVVHRIDEAGDLVRLDAGQVVADRHVEHVRAGPTVVRVADELVQRLPLLQHLDDHPRLDVLLEALVDEQLLAPLDVVADGLHVDARPGDLEVVEDLDRLQLEQSGTTEPRQHDVLRHLAVRVPPPGRRGWRPGGRGTRTTGRRHPLPDACPASRIVRSGRSKIRLRVVHSCSIRASSIGSDIGVSGGVGAAAVGSVGGSEVTVIGVATVQTVNRPRQCDRGPVGVPGQAGVFRVTRTSRGAVHPPGHECTKRGARTASPRRRARPSRRRRGHSAGCVRAVLTAAGLGTIVSFGTRCAAALCSGRRRLDTAIVGRSPRASRRSVWTNGDVIDRRSAE